MDLPSKAIIDVLTFLLPGFVAAALVYVLTPAIRPIPFERIVQALIYTIVVQALLVVAKWVLIAIGFRCCSIGPWTNDVALVWSMVLALVVGIVTAWANNTDAIHKRLRKLGITLQTSFPSEWFGAFASNEGYIVLHLPGQRRLYGWAEEWPSTPDAGHFVIVQAEWLEDSKRIPLDRVHRVVIRAADVEMVEMMKPAPIEARPRAAPEETPTAPVAGTLPALIEERDNG
jgi:hypothetical protein